MRRGTLAAVIVAVLGMGGCGVPAGTDGDAAHQRCDDAARAFLGDHWQAGRVLLTVSLPSKDTWSAGGRWFRCDLRELDERSAPGATEVQALPRRASLRGGLRGERPLARGCYTAGVPVSCSTRHDLEFAGLFHATVAAYADAAKTKQTGREGCLGVVARYVAVPRARYRQYAGWTVGATYTDEYSHPVRAFRCYVQSKRPVSRTLKGAGPDGMP